MKFFGMGMVELIVILIIVALIFGPRNLPKLGNAIGKTISSFRSGLQSGRSKKGKADSKAAGGSDIENETRGQDTDGEIVIFEDREPGEDKTDMEPIATSGELAGARQS